SIMIEVALADSPPAWVNGAIAFRVELEPGASWHTCLLWRPAFGKSRPQHPPNQCHALVIGTDRDKAQRRWVDAATRFTTNDPGVTDTVRQAVEDLASMRMERHDDAAAGESPKKRRSKDAWVPAGGIPWFVSLFGRDALTVSLQTVALSSRFAQGSLRALGALQADGYDDARDMQPGKIEHEVRHGELASLHLVPHTPYYGSHESTSLYVLTAATAWRWHGDRAALDAVRPNVERALNWIDTDGDIDGDGLQEYKTRAPGGYYNQGWKDSGDAIVGRDGRISELPIALCEHQGLVVAAKRAWADVVERVYDERAAATRLRSEADALAEQIETRFWWAEEGTYYLGLDGGKKPIESVSSNPGLLLWLRAVTPERAASVATRLLADDMWTGWGIRTLSAAHPSYNPFSYQLGSVWPHDNAFAASGFRNYGFDAQACQVARGFFDAAERFAARRLPELFAGLERDNGSFPVQYLGANVPQAWASGAVVQILAALLGLDADASAGELVVRPALPEWLTEIQVERLTVGKASVDLRVQRDDDGKHNIDVSMRKGHLDVQLET
ncbi:MAG: amylo-alpha-1,6-glucosidase, partial [Actinobacteria bacterium]|nr:amylo-alpha-1,6-glucosidase [Actinomycetota bacterium]